MRCQRHSTSSMAHVSAWPMWSVPVTLGGGRHMINFFFGLGFCDNLGVGGVVALRLPPAIPSSFNSGGMVRVGERLRHIYLFSTLRGAVHVLDLRLGLLLRFLLCLFPQGSTLAYPLTFFPFFLSFFFFFLSSAFFGSFAFSSSSLSTAALISSACLCCLELHGVSCSCSDPQPRAQKACHCCRDLRQRLYYC